jgi:hypothetical protein
MLDTKNEMNKAVPKRRRKVNDRLGLNYKIYFENEVEEIESDINLKLNPEKALWVYAKMHQFCRTNPLHRIEQKLVRVSEIVTWKMLDEQFPINRYKLQLLNKEILELYNLFHELSDWNILDSAPDFTD